MKIVGYDEFCRMPAGTVFIPYKPCISLGSITIKVDEGEMWDDHWYFNGVMNLEPDFTDDPDNMMFKIGDEKPATFSTWDGTNSDYEEFKMFIVFDTKDIDELISVLNWAKAGCEEIDKKPKTQLEYLNEVLPDHPKNYANNMPNLCPSYYGLKDHINCPSTFNCEECWNQVMPEEE